MNTSPSPRVGHQSAPTNGPNVVLRVCPTTGLSGTRIYAALGISPLMPTPGLCRVVWVAAGDAGGRGRARGIIRVVVGGSEVVEEGQHGVRRSVTSGRCAGPGEAVEGLLLEGEIGVQVDHRGVGLLVTEPQRDHG